MNWLAVDLTNLFRCHWIQGCVMILVFFWAFLALLGIRNARFPWRILGGLSFVIGSTLWLGLHPGIEFDTGDLGRIVQHSLAGRISSSFALSGLSALLLVCSLIGLLVAIDWLPLLPFAPMLARDEERCDGARLAGVPTGFVSPKIDRPDEELALARSAAAAVAPRVRAPVPAPAAPPLSVAAPTPVATPTPPIPTLALPAVAPVVPPPTPRAALVPPATDEVESHDSEAGERDDAEPEDDDAPTNWARFRPRTRAEIDAQEAAARELQPPQVEAHEEETAEVKTADKARPQPDSASAESHEIGDELAVDNGAATSHNSTALEGETRAVEDDATEEKKEDAPVLDRDQDPTEDAPHGTLAVAESLPDAPEAALAETLAPRRKKEEEEPAEEPEKEDDEEEEGEEEEGDDDDFDDEDSEEEEDEDEEFEEEDDEKEGDKEEEEEEEEEEDWDDEEEEEEEEEEDDDEDWEEDDEEEKEDDDEEEKEEEDDESSSRTDPPPSAEAASEAVASSAVELAPAEEAPADTGRPEEEVEFLAGDSAEATVTDAADGPSAEAADGPSAEAAPAPADVAKHLFPDLPDEEAVVMVRAVDLIAGAESVSLSRLQRELGITYYAAARVFERLEKEGFLAPYTGSLARAVRITREEWTELQADGGAG